MATPKKGEVWRDVKQGRIVTITKVGKKWVYWNMKNNDSQLRVGWTIEEFTKHWRKRRTTDRKSQFGLTTNTNTSYDFNKQPSIDNIVCCEQYGISLNFNI